MKVALVVSAFPKLSETFIVNKFLGLLDEGWDVQVVCARSEPSEWERSSSLQPRKDLKQRVHTTLPVHPRLMVVLLLPVALLLCLFSNTTGTLRYLRLGWKIFGTGTFRHLYLDEQLLRMKPNIIHFEFGALAVGRTYLGELLGCKLVVSFRGYDLNFSGIENVDYYQEVWRDVDSLHLLGEDLWRRAQRRGCPPDKSHALIPPAINADLFDPGNRSHTEVAGTADRPLRILSVGRLEWKKGYEYGLQAVRLLMDSGLHCEYHIVGDGAYLEAVAFARHQLELDNVVKLLMSQPRHEVKTEMLWADILLHPAVTEGFCNAVLEGQAMMLPVVSSDAGGLSENVSDGITGYVVLRRNPSCLAEKLSFLSSRPELRQKMGLAGRKRVIDIFQAHNQVRAFGNMYMQVLESETVMENARALPAVATDTGA